MKVHIGIILITALMFLVGASCARKAPPPGLEASAERMELPTDLARETIMFRFGHRYGHDLENKRLEEHQIVHEMRELLLDAGDQDLENFRRGFRLGYGPDGLRVFGRVWKEAQIPLYR